MPSTVIDSLIFRDMFGTAAMRAVFSDEALVRRYLEVEVALAQAEAATKVIPAEAAVDIAAAARTMRIDFDRLRHETEITGYPIIAIVHQLAEAAGAAGGYVHWGATTQDIMDSATVLQIRAALDLVAADLAELRDILAGLARKYRDTPMAGRTHLQQALPITFGYKAAVWLSMIQRHIERLEQMRPRVLLGQFAGAAGTLASLGADGLKVQAALCDLLGLARPSATWHVARDGLAEVVSVPGPGHRQPRQDRDRRHADDGDRVRRGGRALREGPRRLLDHAAEAQPDLLRTDARRRQGGPPACRADAGRHGAGSRARHRPVACRVDRHPRELHPDRRARWRRPNSCSAA